MLKLAIHGITICHLLLRSNEPLAGLVTKIAQHRHLVLCEPLFDAQAASGRR